MCIAQVVKAIKTKKQETCPEKTYNLTENADTQVYSSVIVE